MMTTTNKGNIIKEAVERYPSFGNLTIAKIVIHNQGDIFENNLERIRALVRHYRGAMGEQSKKYRVDGKPTTPKTQPLTWRKVRTPYNLSPGLWLILADVHAPFHDIKAVEAAIAYGKSQNIDGVLYNGDLQDCASISYWMSDRKRDFDKETETFIDFLDFLCYEFQGKKQVYKPGNHEYRLPRIYQSKMPELAGIPLAIMDEIYNFDGRGIEFLEYYQKVYAGKLPILHGHEVRNLAVAVSPARGLFLRFLSWGMCSHVHRTSENSERNIEGTLLTTWTTGCLCDLSPDYDPYANKWNHGSALVNVDKDGSFEVRNFRILPSGKVV
jgi:hypothetical protein